MKKVSGIVFQSKEEADKTLEELEKIFEEEKVLSIYRINELMKKTHNDEDYKFLGFESLAGFRVEKIYEYLDGDPAWIIHTPGLKVIR